MCYLLPVSVSVDMAGPVPGGLGECMDDDGGRLAAESSDSGEAASSRKDAALSCPGTRTTLPERLGASLSMT